MNLTTRPQTHSELSIFTFSVGLLLMFGLALASAASASTITVGSSIDIPLIGGPCTLRQAIDSHNHKKSPFGSGCTTGGANGIDTITLNISGNTIDLGSPLPPIERGTVTIVPSQNNVCYNLRNSTYMSVHAGASLKLQGISVVVNGAEFRSVVENNGGTLNITPNGTSGPCYFSNQLGRERKVESGGVLVNRNNGTATINANFQNSSAGVIGGAINVESGTVEITGGNFTGNNALEGGAIYVKRGAKLNITSSNFSISNNLAARAGAAIYNHGGTVSIQRDVTQTLNSVSIAANKAGSGGAIYSNGGQLSIDGIQFSDNSANSNGGAILLSALLPTPNPASITRTYFHDNTAGGNGAALYATAGSLVDLSQDTFLRDKGGIYVDDLTDLNIINSTFLGSSSATEGITVASGLGRVTFSTLALTNLNGPDQAFELSNSILREVACNAGVEDEGGNLQFQIIPTALCPATIQVNNPALDAAGLKDNGGPTPTIALTPTSPAIDQIVPPNCVDLNEPAQPLTIDQRGFGRPDVAGTNCDIGAYEFGAVAVGTGIGGLPPGTTF